MPHWSAGRFWGLTAGALLVLLAGAAVMAIYTGFYNIAADVPHPQPIYWLYETVRDRSVAARARVSLFQRIWMIEPHFERRGPICGDVQRLSSCTGHGTYGD